MGAAKAQRIDSRHREQLAASPVTLSKVATLFRPHRWPLVAVTTVIVAASLITLGQPFLIRLVIDDALPTSNRGLLILAVIGMLAVATAQGLLGVLQTWLATSIGQDMLHRLRARVFQHLQLQSMDFFRRTRSGEVQSRLINDISGMQSVITTTATSIAANLTTAIATVVAMAALSWRLALLSFAILPPAIWTTRRVAIVRHSVTKRRQEAMSNLLVQAEEALSVSGALLSKTLGTAPTQQARFESTSATLVQLELQSKLAGRWRMAVMTIAFAAIPAATYLAAGFPATAGDLTLGTLIAFTTLQVAVFKPILSLLNVGADWIASLALLSRIFDYLDLPVEVPVSPSPTRLPRSSIRGEVRFANVSYRYPTGDHDVLANIDLEIDPGQSIAIVGETGSGKSTLASLLLRLADPTSGKVTVDGHDLKDLDPHCLTHIVGVVSQDPYLSHATIRENLLMARPDATESDIVHALSVAQISDTVARLPEGLDTTVGSRGHLLSGGERQRLVIARAVLRDPRVLVLDEATSALDTATEQELQSALNALAQGRTTITIAHRLTTVSDADVIYVLDGGRFAESGSHDELMARGGLYATLVGKTEASQTTPTIQEQTTPTAHATRSYPDAAPPEDFPLAGVMAQATKPGRQGAPRRAFVLKPRRRHSVMALSAVAAVLGVVLVGTSLLSNPAPATSSQQTADEAVHAFLEAWRAADTERVLTYLDRTPGSEDVPSVEPAALKQAHSLAQVTDIEVSGSTSGNVGLVKASYRIGGRRTQTTFDLIKRDGRWLLTKALTPLPVPRSVAGLAVLINGVPVTERSILVLPGTYAITVAAKYLQLPRTQLRVNSPGSVKGRVRTTVHPSDDAKAKFVALGRKSLAECLASRKLKPPGCPNAVTLSRLSSIQPRPATWTLLGDPFANLKITAASGDATQLRLSMSIQVRLVVIDPGTGRVLFRLNRLTLKSTLQGDIGRDSITVAWHNL